jgi:hypothetical protein
MKELEDEIGELSGLDEDMIDAPGFGTTLSSTFGSFIGQNNFPVEWKDQMDFFKEIEASETLIKTKLRGGKAAEKIEFENLLKEAELELQQASTRSSPRAVATPVSPEAETIVASLPEGNNKYCFFTQNI